MAGGICIQCHGPLEYNFFSFKKIQHKFVNSSPDFHVFKFKLIADTDISVFRNYQSTLCLKTLTFKLSVTLSNVNRFSKILDCWKAYKICYKTHTTIPTSPHACCYTTLKN